MSSNKITYSKHGMTSNTKALSPTFSLIDGFINFNGISTRLGLFYADMLRNRVQCSFVFNILCSCFLTVVLFYFILFHFFILHTGLPRKPTNQPTSYLAPSVRGTLGTVELE